MNDLFDASNLAAWPPDDPDILASLNRAIAAGAWGANDDSLLQELKTQLAERFGVQHAVLCSSGTAATEFAIKAIQIKAGQRIVVAGFDYPGNLRAVEHSGAVPVIVDVAPGRWTIDLNAAESALKNGASAVLASHLYGDCFDAKALRGMCEAHGALLIEDACQAHGATIAGQPAGSWGHVGLLSFGQSKLVTSACGGALLTSDARIAQRAVIANERPGPVAPLTSLQAAIILPQLAKLDQRNAVRINRIDQLHDRLRGSQLWAGAVKPIDDCEPVFFKAAWNIPANWSRDPVVALGKQMGLPLGAGFHTAMRRAKRLYPTLGQLAHSQRCVDRCLVMHHRALLSDERTLDAIAQAMLTLEASLSEQTSI